MPFDKEMLAMPMRTSVIKLQRFDEKNRSANFLRPR